MEFYKNKAIKQEESSDKPPNLICHKNSGKRNNTEINTDVQIDNEQPPPPKKRYASVSESGKCIRNTSKHALQLKDEEIPEEAKDSHLHVNPLAYAETLWFDDKMTLQDAFKSARPYYEGSAHTYLKNLGYTADGDTSDEDNSSEDEDDSSDEDPSNNKNYSKDDASKDQY